jgi:hypothetical protein
MVFDFLVLSSVTSCFGALGCFAVSSVDYNADENISNRFANYCLGLLGYTAIVVIVAGLLL